MSHNVERSAGHELWERLRHGALDGEICEHCDEEPTEINRLGDLLCPTCAVRFGGPGYYETSPLGRTTRRMYRPFDEPNRAGGHP